MAELSSKKPVRRIRKAANSPAPEPMTSTGGGDCGGPTCGHTGCGTSCNVRYVGPTSHMRDHHIMHTARGVSQVWTAAIVAGLAVVLTGAIAWNSVDAQSKIAADPNLSAIRASVDSMAKRMDSMEVMLKQLASQCRASVTSCTPTTTDGTAKTDPKACYDSCVANGKRTKDECKKACTPPPTTTGNVCIDSCLKDGSMTATQCRQKCVTPTGGTTTETTETTIPTNSVTCAQTCEANAKTCLKEGSLVANNTETCKAAYGACLVDCKKQ